MEESTNRRERLKAMREEASQAAIYNNTEESNISHTLSNPLIETSGTEPVEAESRGSHRFDYYTDPMSAFSGNKRSSKVSPQTPKDHFTPPSFSSIGMLPPPQEQSQMNNQQIYQAQGPTYFPSNSPRGLNLPTPNFNTGQGRGPWFSNNPGPSGGGPRGGPSGSPRFWHGGNSPDFNPGQARGQWNPSFNPGQGRGQWNPSFNPGQARGHWFNNNLSPGGTVGGTTPSSPGSGRINSPSFNPQQGRGHWSNNTPGGPGGIPGFVRESSPNFNPQQGRGNQFNSPGYAGPSSGRPGWFNPGPGRGGGRGRGGHNNVSAEQRPDLYYKKSMVDDPWKLLEPIVWRRENIPSLNKKSWVPESIRVKKVRVTETPKESGSKQSLAEYLAASFYEAVNEEQPGE